MQGKIHSFGELLGLDLRRKPELGGEHITACLILLERQRPFTLAIIEPHERPVGGLPQGIEREQPPGRGNRRLAIPDRLVVEQFGEPLAGALVEALALITQPVLEGRVVDADTVEEISSVELSCPFERRGRPVVDQPLELGHVHVECVGIEQHGIALGNKR